MSIAEAFSASKTMSTLPKEDFYNIMEGIAVSAGAESVA